MAVPITVCALNNCLLQTPRLAEWFPMLSGLSGQRLA